jgi:hypothetical protein
MSRTPVYDSAPTVGHLVIQILGPLRAWDVDHAGTWNPLHMPGGDGTAGLLATLIFNPKIRNWDEVIEYLWDRKDVEVKPEAARVDMRRLASYVRKHLDNHADVLAKGATPGLQGRRAGRSDAPLWVDWDYFTYYQRAGKHREALSLVSDMPLPGHLDGSLRLGRLLAEIRKEVGQAICESLEDLEVPIPADPSDIYGHIIEQFVDYRPAEWTPALQPSSNESSPVQKHTGGELVDRRRAGRRQRLMLYGDLQAVDLFEPCPEGEERLALELQQAEQDRAHTWWSKGEWLGKYFAFWFKVNTRPCDKVAISITNDIYDGARFDEPGRDAPKDKATIIEAPSFYGDNPDKEITCGLTNWGLAYVWGKAHGDEMLAHPSRPSVFGVVGRPVFPGIAGVHTLVQTSDGYVLFGLRAPDIAFHERTWSATFEEQIAVGAREFTGPPEGDRTLLHTIEGGLCEEWGIEEDAIELTSCLAIGREWGRGEYRGEPVLNLTSTIITACRLAIPLASVWAALDRAETVEDIDEHRAWAGIRFASRADVLRFVASAKGRHDNGNLLEELCSQPGIDAEISIYAGGASASIRDRGLMPTSAARMVLASGWFETL